jgi:hypothetical protein
MQVFKMGDTKIARENGSPFKPIGKEVTVVTHPFFSIFDGN